MKVKDIAKYIEEWCPKSLAEEWDNVGLIIGNPEQEVKKVMVALDAIEEVIDEAIEKNVDLIVTHHPLLIKPINRISTDFTTGKLIHKLIKNNISLYSAHTNLDIAEGGINDILATLIGLNDRKPIEVTYQRKLKKLVVLVPVDHIETVRDAISRAGAGWMGNYSDCTFMTEGTGTFKPLEGANPYIGSVGNLEKVKEYRLETIFEDRIQSKVINAMLNAHPYEEVAYDIYTLDNKGMAYGIGRVGESKSETSLNDFAKLVKERLGLDSVRVIGDLNAKVNKVAICSGSGMSLIDKAIASGVDVYITGDVNYHNANDAMARGINIIDAGHYGTENIIVPVMKKYIEKLEGIEVIETSVNGNPFREI